MLKGIEYAGHLAEGIAPGHYYAFDALPARGAVLYVTLYYVLTGLHALHVTGGVVRARSGSRGAPGAATSRRARTSRSSSVACTGTSSTSCGSSCGRLLYLIR